MNERKPISHRLYSALVKSPTLNFELKQRQGEKTNLDVALFDCACTFCMDRENTVFASSKSNVVSFNRAGTGSQNTKAMMINKEKLELALVQLLKDRGIDEGSYLPTRSALRSFVKLFCDELWEDHWGSEPTKQAMGTMKSSFARASKSATVKPLFAHL